MEPRKEILQTEQLYSFYTLKKEHTKGTDMAFTRILGLNMELSDFTSHHDSPLQSERQPCPLVLSWGQTLPTKARVSSILLSTVLIILLSWIYQSSCWERELCTLVNRVPGTFHRQVTCKLFWKGPTKTIFLLHNPGPRQTQNDWNKNFKRQYLPRQHVIYSNTFSSILSWFFIFFNTGQDPPNQNFRIQ